MVSVVKVRAPVVEMGATEGGGRRAEKVGGVGGAQEAVVTVEESGLLQEPSPVVPAGVNDNIGNDAEAIGEVPETQATLPNNPIQINGVPIAKSPSNHSTHSRMGVKDLIYGGPYVPLRPVEDLDQAISQAEKAIDTTPTNPNRASKLAELGGLYESRYERFGQPDDLEKAIMRAEESIAITDYGHRYRAGRLYCLGSLLYIRYQGFGRMEDLQLAIDKVEEAARERLIKNSLPWALLNLRGECWLAMYDLTGALDQYAKGTAFVDQALAAMPLDDTRRYVVLSNLRGIAERQYTRSQASEDLDLAIQRGEEITAAVPFDHYGRGHLAFDQAQLVRKRYELSANPQDLNRVLHLAYKAMHCTLSSPFLRINAARLAAQMLHEKGLWSDEKSLLAEAVKMLPMVPLPRDGEQNRLVDVAQIPPLAAPAAIQAGEEPAEVLRLLEFGRGVILGSIIGCSSDLSDLKTQHPDLQDKFNDLRIRIDLPAEGFGQALGIMGENGKFNVLDRHTRQAGTAQEFNDILASIRGFPGFERFHLPPNSVDLMALASEGPIVVFNSATIRSDAIIVTTSSIRLLALPKLSYESVCIWMSRLIKLPRGRRHSYSVRNLEMNQLLLWLWEAAVEPVFEELGFVTGARGASLPHIWWVGVGPLAMAPFHAAGDHSRGSTRNTMSRAVSSNISTFNALSRARRRKLELLSGSSSRLLLVAMPTTPGNAPPLSNVLEELHEIEGIVEAIETIHPTILDCPSTEDVIQEIQTCDAVHFACHGVYNVKSPSESHLLLRNKDGSLDKLTVGTISKMELGRAQIAFLSSCGTAKHVPENLADESIHIGSGFQLAGFSHVLATQWVSNDEACRKVAGGFYRNLFGNKAYADGGGANGDHWKVRAAFHYAVEELRNKNRNQPLYWASFTHTGA